MSEPLHGHGAKLQFSEYPEVSFWEATVTPQSDALETSAKLMPADGVVSMQVAYDPAAYADLIKDLPTIDNPYPTEMAFTYPDGTTYKQRSRYTGMTSKETPANWLESAKAWVYRWLPFLARLWPVKTTLEVTTTWELDPDGDGK